MACDASLILTALQTRAAETTHRDELGRTLVDSLSSAFPQATWAGIYWLEGDELLLGPYVGPATEHTRIPVGQGVCGHAVLEGRDRIVQDVREIDNYLACSASTRSEIVILIRSMGEVIGQIDMDADTVGAFGEVDRCILRAVADGFGGLVSSDVSAPLEGMSRERAAGEPPTVG